MRQTAQAWFSDGYEGESPWRNLACRNDSSQGLTDRQFHGLFHDLFHSPRQPQTR